MLALGTAEGCLGQGHFFCHFLVKIDKNLGVFSTKTDGSCALKSKFLKFFQLFCS